ncbi:mercuric reductase [Desulfatirhabdium butyrativorans]|uniref:mercuric reductase n=1 Tax=Desulfatirhabdium butyrativorans TaxID=340467 RepID=UPI0003F8FC76|nr:mercuric reductase [Desulfatirhabdium butyrativorans]
MKASETTILSPWDTHNQQLASHVHPLDWQNPKPASRYNLVVIGAGTAGLVCAAGAAGLGAKVALIERHLMGGDCLNIGCVPSKAVIRAARAAAAARNARTFGVHIPEGMTIDFGQVMERMRRLRASIAPHDSVQRFSNLGIDVFMGDGRFVDSHTVEVAGERLAFKKAVIATGARAAAPPIEGLSEISYLTNETVFSLTELPRRMAVIGAGPIGCEMAQSFARFGSEVLLVETMHGILPREDADASDIVLESMQQDGVKLLCCGKNLKLAKAEGGKIRLTVTSHGKGYDEVVDQLLVAVGRAPNVEHLGLEAAGVAFNKKGVQVNDYLQTSQPHIYAAGDICSPYQFTHAADFMARIVIRNALFFGRSKASALTIPWCTYTEPEIAHVGLYEKQALEQGIAVDTFTRTLNEVDRAILEGHTNGLARVHVRKGTDKILGATIVAANAGDMIAEITLAMTHNLGLGRIANTIHPYPTQAEVLRQIGDAYNRTRLTPFVQSLFSRLMAWRR